MSLETSFGLLLAADLRWLQVSDRKLIESLSLSFLDLLSLSEPLGNLDLDQWANDLILLLLVFFDPSFGNIGFITDLLDINLGEFVHFLRSANTAAEREDTTFSWIGIRSRMGDTQGAVDAIAVLERRSQGSVVLFMARMAEVMSTKAAIKGSRTAELAFPIDLLGTVLSTRGFTSTDLLKETVLAHKVLFLLLLTLLGSHKDLTVN